MRVLNIKTECFPTKITAIRCGCQSDYSWSAVITITNTIIWENENDKKKIHEKKGNPSQPTSRNRSDGKTNLVIER